MNSGSEVCMTLKLNKRRYVFVVSPFVFNLNNLLKSSKMGILKNQHWNYLNKLDELNSPTQVLAPFLLCTCTTTTSLIHQHCRPHFKKRRPVVSTDVTHKRLRIHLQAKDRSILSISP